jgi:putative flippase GtrA
LKNLWKQAVTFIGLSGIGWFLDFSVYTCLRLVSESFSLNNIISSWVGVTFVFLIAAGNIFQNRSKISLRWKYVIYLLYQSILIFCISNLLAVVHSMICELVTIDLILRFSFIISKILVTPITMILNFIVMKGVIEKL